MRKKWRQIYMQVYVKMLQVKLWLGSTLCTYNLRNKATVEQRTKILFFVNGLSFTTDLLQTPYFVGIVADRNATSGSLVFPLSQTKVLNPFLSLSSAKQIRSHSFKSLFHFNFSFHRLLNVGRCFIEIRLR